MGIPATIASVSQRENHAGLSALCRYESTSGRASCPAATGSRGRLIRSISQVRFAASGMRAASAASRSTTRPTTATGSQGTCRTPIPRTSIRPASEGAGRTSSRPLRASTTARSSATRRANGSAQDQCPRPGPGPRPLQQRERQPRLAGTGWPPDQHGAAAHQHGRGVNGRRHQTVGSSNVKRAPSTRGASSAEAGTAVRFSALSVPRWASTICLEIERPSPEFWPKPWCGRSV